jgi:hypothetical protein
MNKVFYMTLYFRPQLRSCLLIAALFFSVPVFAQTKDVAVRISQDESSVALADFETTVQLKKRAFKFLVMLQNVKGVYVFASIRDSIYRFTETSPIRDFVYLPLLELREDEYNANKELNISETGWSYWFYDTAMNWHPFHNKIVGLGNGKIIGTKTIKQFYDVTEREVIKIRQISTPLYLFFVAVAEYDENGTPRKELLRKKVKIEWVKED